MEQRSEPLGVYLDGFLIEHLLPEHEELLRTLARKDSVEILSGFYFEPNLALCTLSELVDHFALTQAFWTRMGRENCSTCALLGSRVSPEQVQLLVEHGISFILASSEAFTSSSSSIVIDHQGKQTTIALIDHFDSSEESSCEISESEAVALRAELFTPQASEPAFETPLVAHQRKELREELAKLPDYVRENPLEYVNKERLANAKKWYLRSQHRPSTQNDSSLSLSLALRKKTYHCLLHAQVEIDAIYHPEIDPNDGWLEESRVTNPDGTLASITLHTPFAHYLFSPLSGAGLRALGYKPRKLALLDVGDGSARTSFSALLCEKDGCESEQELVPGELSIPRKNPGVYVVRATQSLDPERYGKEAQVVKDFMIKSGLGAHRPNATTGFSLEYWLEGVAQDALDSKTQLAISCHYLPPSLSGELLQLRALLPAGGISDEACSLEVERSISLPRSLSGVRLIDSLDQFVIDFRSAKPLSSVETTPLFYADESESIFAGVQLRFLLPLKEVLDSFESNSLFVSIN